MRYLSLFSGLGGAELAFMPLGWKCIGVSEIDPAACAVLAHHYTDVPNFGNVNNIKADELIGKVDLMIGGCPCQSFSIAGLRKSLGDARGNLTLKYVELTHAIDPEWTVFENVPGILNTPDNAFGCFLAGMVGSDTELIPARGQRWTDSGVVTGPLRTAAWRILDAQYLGVAQRRRRVFVLTVRGSRNWKCAAALLPISKGLQRYPPSRKEKGERLAGCLKGGSGSRGWPDPSDGNGGGMVAGTLGRGYGDRGRDIDGAGAFIPEYVGALACNTGPNGHDAGNFASNQGVDSGYVIPEWPAEIAQTLDSHFGDKQGLEDQHIRGGASLFVPCKPIFATDGQGKAAFAEDMACAINATHEQPYVSVPMLNMQGSKGNSVAQDDGPSFTLNAMHGHDVHVIGVTSTLCAEGDAHSGSRDANGLIAFTQNSRDEVRVIGEDGSIAGSLSAETGTHQTTYVAAIQNATRGQDQNGIGVSEDDTMYTLDQASQHAVSFHTSGYGGQVDEDISQTLQASDARLSNQVAGIIQAMQVRRLTPKECARLQGVPDSHLDIVYKGKPLADSAKYKMLGNGFAIPVVNWIGKRIKLVEDLHE